MTDSEKLGSIERSARSVVSILLLWTLLGLAAAVWVAVAATRDHHEDASSFTR